jgi:hypothetical protein
LFADIEIGGIFTSTTTQNNNAMTLANEISQNPYLKVSNCTDKSDCNYAIEECERLEKKYGQSRTLDKIWVALINKKNRLAQ